VVVDRSPLAEIINKLGDLDRRIDRLGAARLLSPGAQLIDLGINAVAVKTKLMNLDVSLAVTGAFVEMSTSYRIAHALSKSGNQILAICIANLILNAGETAYGALMVNAANGGIFAYTSGPTTYMNLAWAGLYSPADLTSRNYCPGWMPAGAYQIDSFGATVATGTFIIAEINQS